MHIAADAGQRIPQGRRRARVSRIVSWLFIAASLAVLVVFAVQLGVFDFSRPDAASGKADVAKPASPDQFAAESSRLTGFDRDKQPFELNAASAVQDAGNDKIVHMKGVSAQLKQSDGEVLRITANTARYDASANILDLIDDVRIAVGEQFVATMPSARIRLDKKVLLTDKDVSVRFASGRIEAAGMRVSDNGAVVEFFNGVVTQIDGKTTDNLAKSNQRTQ